MPTSARTKFFPHPRQGTRALPYKVLCYRARVDRVVRPYTRTLVVGSEPSAAGGRGSEVSERPRSKFPASAVRQHRNFGHRNRVIRNTLAQSQRGTDCHNQ